MTPETETRTTTTKGKPDNKKSMTAPERASQIWQIVVHKAAVRETVTYGEVADLMGIGSARGLGAFLDYIKRYCSANRLPPLHVLVVSKATGAPGKGLRVVDFEAERDRVFDFNWFAVVPPRPENLPPPPVA